MQNILDYIHISMGVVCGAVDMENEAVPKIQHLSRRSIILFAYMIAAV